jgi:hypothetical protein
MYIDSRLEFSVSQALSAAGASANVIDVGDEQLRKIGPGEPLWVIVQPEAAVAAAVTVSVQTSDTETFTAVTTLATVNVPAATPAGARFVLGFPYNNQRFIRLDYSAAITASAWLTSQEPQSWEPYPAQT